MRMRFADHFSAQARAYADARPGYPPELFSWLADQCPGHDLAWDVACGNGQASVALAAHFDRVWASDASANQIAAARPQAGVHYVVEPAEACTLAAASADLVTVAQAWHWFDRECFATEVRRVLRPGGLFAAFNYGLSAVTPMVDLVFHRLYHDVLGDDWPPERQFAVERFGELPLPFPALTDCPTLTIECRWTLGQYLAYLRSWSASQRYRQRTGSDPVDLLGADFARAWADPDQIRTVRWPLTLRAGRKPDQRC